MKKPVLGRGLSALISDTTIIDDIEKTQQKDIQVVPTSLLKQSRFQPRKLFDDQTMVELANSIITNGVIQPIVVRENPNELGTYEIIAGERRWRAAIKAKVENVPIIIKNISDKQCLVFSIIENIQRQDLTPIEEAESYKKLIEQFFYKHEELSKMMGKSRSHITNMIRILSLPQSIKNKINNGELTLGHAKALINVENSENLVEKIIADGLNVRQTELLIKKSNNLPIKNTEKQKEMVNEDIKILEDLITKKLNLNVKIEESLGSGRVLIKFLNLKELDSILQKLSGNMLHQILQQN